MLALSLGPGWRVFTIEGQSMVPAYQPGDLIFTAIKPASEIEPGDTIVFHADWASGRYGGRVAHRVAAVGRYNGGVYAYTQGDHNLIADPDPVDVTDGIRVVTAYVPAGGKWARLVGTPFVIASLGTLAAGLIGAALSSLTPAARNALRRLRGDRTVRA
jgi:signal peptidase I